VTAIQEGSEMLLSAVQVHEPLIRAHADESEQNRRLSQPVVRALAEAGFFRLYTPRSLGGLEVDPLTFYRVVEAIARIDGSTAWCVWIGGAAAPLVKTLVDPTAEEISGRDPQVVTAGIHSASGNAVAKEGGMW
jgi:indole-3-acetate monooxygenase